MDEWFSEWLKQLPKADEDTHRMFADALEQHRSNQDALIEALRKAGYTIRDK